MGKERCDRKISSAEEEFGRDLFSWIKATLGWYRNYKNSSLLTHEVCAISAAAIDAEITLLS